MAMTTSLLDSTIIDNNNNDQEKISDSAFEVGLTDQINHSVYEAKEEIRDATNQTESYARTILDNVKVSDARPDRKTEKKSFSPSRRE